VPTPGTLLALRVTVDVAAAPADPVLAAAGLDPEPAAVVADAHAEEQAAAHQPVG
jgi:hypothetical protein